MGSLNRYASHIANIVGRPMDHTLMERVKESIKSIFAARIRQSTFKFGVDYNFLLNCEVPVKLETSPVKGFTVFSTDRVIPKSIRFASDAPYVRVTLNGISDIPFSNRTTTEIQLSAKSDVKGFHRYYTITDGFVKFYIRTDTNNFSLNTADVTKGIITSIFESPEEVLGMYSTEDMQDIDLPFPNEMFESIVAELLQTEFRIQPAPEVEVKV